MQGFDEETYTEISSDFVAVEVYVEKDTLQQLLGRQPSHKATTWKKKLLTIANNDDTRKTPLLLLVLLGVMHDAEGNDLVFLMGKITNDDMESKQ
jgi:hypothetical protein